MTTPYRLPIVNSDDGIWGDILRQYIKQEHYDDGTDNQAENGGHQFITIRPGVSGAGGAPITFNKTGAALLATKEDGAMEYDGTYFYLTTSPGGTLTRKTVATYDDASGVTGDIYYRNSSGYFARVPIGSGGNVLTVAGSPAIPTWASTASLGSTTPIASTLAEWDANVNLSANAFTPSTASTPMTGGTLTLDITKAQIQVFTGSSSTGHTVLLPTTSVAAGAEYTIINQNSSTGTVTVQSSGANTITTLAPLTVGVFRAQKATPTALADWVADVRVDGSVLTVTNTASVSGTNTGDQTITLTGAVTGSGTGSFATTIATPGTLTVSSTNSTATAHTHAITSSSAPGAAASILATDSSGIIGSTGTRIVKGWFTDLTVTNSISGSITGTASNLSGTPALPNGTTATTQSAGDNSTKLATTAYTDGAVATAVQSGNNKPTATVVATSALPAGTYSNGTSGQGATYTVTATGTTTIDGYTLAANDVVLVTAQASGFQNGLYTVTTAGTAGVSTVLTRSTSMDTTTKYVGAVIHVGTGGTTYADTVWFVTNTSAPTVGTTSITFSQQNFNLSAIPLTGTTAQFNAALSDNDFATLAGAEALTNKNLTGAGNTFPTFNQNTTGSAATLTTPRAIYGNNFDGSAALNQVIASTYGGTGNGFTKFSGPTTSEKTFTLPDASSTIVVQGGALGTPSSGTLTNATGLPITGVTGLGTGVATFLGTPSSANLASAITDETGSGALVFGTSPTLATPVINGTATGSGVSSTPTASILAMWDANKNLSANNVFEGFTTTVTSATPVTLTISSTETQVFTGSTAQTVTLPTTNVPAGAQWRIINNSTAVVTVQSSGANTVAILPPTGSGVYTALIATPAAAADWDAIYTSVTPRVGSTASSATPSIDCSQYDVYKITALAADITSWTITSTPADRQALTITIKDTAATTHNIAWTASFVASGTTSLPNVTSQSKTITLKFVYDADISKWVLMAGDIYGY